MDSFMIKGPCRLKGSVTISGAKNAMLPLMAATIFTGGKCRLENVPDLRDTRTMIKLLKVLGIPAELNEGTLDVDASDPSGFEAPYDLVRTMRASIYALGPLVARFGKARVSLPGGCAWGPRPINLHLQGLKSLGAEIRIDHGYIDASADGLKGAEIILAIPSVGATVNLMLAAVLAEGETVIENAACEPEIKNLADALIGAGAKIDGAGSSRIIIEGVSKIDPFTHRVIPDRIEAGTYAAAAVLTGGEVTINDCNPDHMHAVIDKLRSCGAEIETAERSIHVKGPDKIFPVDIETGFYPAFPTDMQAQMMAVMSVADGASSFVEHVYTDRFTHVPELKRLGAKINLDGSVAVVNGVERLQGAPVMATDIRASSALILAALVAEGDTKILRIYHIDRGYEKIEAKFGKLGAEITRISE
ncbi:MAG: UDP-N-acetylglucosamine 1-carboxyvinyltransferase [Candidatus Krumholzibacteriota bacterium]|nr:UDP-N-acetylglucosamine 1-carboxyvinyltransferase [Candidatus Krumholzibacteriota bacterium]